MCVCACVCACACMCTLDWPHSITTAAPTAAAADYHYLTSRIHVTRCFLQALSATLVSGLTLQSLQFSRCGIVARWK
uniref:Putative secreted protein n=1 Tax=Hyalomma excavatum TaxID=257692 RepID=A0A131XHF7_9ACAR